MRIKALADFNFPENERGDRRFIPAGWHGDVPSDVAKAQAKLGAVEILDKPEPAPPAQPAPKPTAEEINAALQELFPKLTAEDWGKDNVPNVNVLKGYLADHFEQSVPLRAPQRDAALATYRAANPDLFQPVPDAGQGDGQGGGQGSDQSGGTDGKAE
jgi:hypothetical protein